ncbi:hypothetical protein FRC02_010799 [Tulasnella sp. 418]|nr:hypothetical protein FRC02_010799 [Tulasnella sp. 418]
MAPASIQERYVGDLEASLQSLETEVKTKSSHQSKPERPAMEKWRDHQSQCEEHVKSTYELVRKSLLPSTPAETVLLHAGLWPCLAPTSLLTALSNGSEVVLNMQWRRTLNSFVRGLLAFQHSCRLMELLREENLEEFYNELKSNVMDAGGDDEQGSIRLLIQVDCNFLTRKVQTDFLREMIAPSSQRNTVLQLNMGEGKSSVIVPIAAALLSDGTKLVRIVVLRPLAPSMMHILVHRLGGLANRRVFYIPFSRTPRLTLDQAHQVRQIFEMCVQERGVLVVQPDHILSFRLLGLDGKLNNPFSPESTICSHLLDSQRWLFNNSRDILDESDEILHVKYQLVYTIGQQQCLHGNQDRWTIAQQILGLVKKHARAISRSYPDGVELMDDHSGGYPHVRILHDEAGTALIHVIAEDILNGALDHFSFDLFPRELRSFALSYITSLEIAADEEHLLEEYCKNHDSWMNLLIIRGLLAHGILQFVLKEKRWRVDYGPDLSRSLLAVPYRAKDVPALRAEFSHPDVAILLTCLSYYWQGLSQNQLEQCFNLLFQQDNPPLEYSKWILQGQGIPESLTHLEAINLRDLDQRTELYTIFHHNQAVIDFFLSQVVFPRGAREFPKKMATSGWDLAEQKTHVTTGFSGTNDGRYLLPTSIKQADPLSQSSTNAKVLMYLLQSENDHYHLIHQVGQENLEESLLHLIVEQKPEIRVLLDVGAQILKLSNEDVAAEWLRLNKDPQVLAAVFFGSDDEPHVRTRDGQIEGLVSSPFRQQLDKCLLYLDDAHTRGTDFKLPPGTRAAVTLGPKVTKDRLVQGCMRMRKLGRGHTIMFFAPLEVDHSIRVSAGVSRDNPIQTKDVVLWTMFESCLEVQHRIPQWAQQGMDYRKREAAWIRFNKSPNFSMKHLEAAWLQNDARSLEEMYGHDQVGSMMGFGRQLEEYPDISATYRKWAPSAFNDTRFQEEQEREVVLEVETERRVVRPMPATAAIPHVAGDIRMLVNSGRFERYSAAFVPLFQRLGEERFEEQSWSSRGLFATRDFCITIRSSRDSNPVNYLRPVQWILSCAQPTETIFVVLSPHEVNELLPDIRNSNQVHLHLYSPRTTQGMKSFEDLAFYCIPPLPASWIKPDLDITTRLNLWAGQLYLEDEKTYHYLCNFLGLYNWQPRKRDKIQPDGFIKPLNRYGTPFLPKQSSTILETTLCNS